MKNGGSFHRYVTVYQRVTQRFARPIKKSLMTATQTSHLQYFQLSRSTTLWVKIASKTTETHRDPPLIKHGRMIFHCHHLPPLIPGGVLHRATIGTCSCCKGSGSRNVAELSNHNVLSTGRAQFCSSPVELEASPEGSPEEFPPEFG